MAKKSMVRLDDPRFAGRDADVFSVRSTGILENGFVGVLGDIEADNRDMRTLGKPTAGASLVLVANPVRIYGDARLGSNLEYNYEIPAKKAARAYGLRKTFIFSVTKEAINGTPVVGEYLVAGATHKLEPLDALLGSETGFIGKVIREDAVGGALSVNTTLDPTTYVVIEVIQN